MPVDADRAACCDFDLNFTCVNSLSGRPKFGPPYDHFEKVVRKRNKRTTQRVWERLLGDLYKPQSLEVNKMGIACPDATGASLRRSERFIRTSIQSSASTDTSQTVMGIAAVSDENFSSKPQRTPQQNACQMGLSLPVDELPEQNSLMLFLDDHPSDVSESTSRVNQLVDAILDLCEDRSSCTPGKTRDSQPQGATSNEDSPQLECEPNSGINDDQRGQQMDDILQLLSGLKAGQGRQSGIEKTIEVTRAVPEVVSTAVRGKMSRRQAEKLREQQLLSPTPQALEDLRHRLAKYKAQMRAERSRSGSKIEQNIRRAKEYCRVTRKVKDPDSLSQPSSPRRSPQSEIMHSVPDPLVAAAWGALIFVAQYPAILMVHAGMLDDHI